jgi:hypothetical protein
MCCASASVRKQAPPPGACVWVGCLKEKAHRSSRCCSLMYVYNI